MELDETPEVIDDILDSASIHHPIQLWSVAHDRDPSKMITYV
jgi:hypothetical protein